MRGNMRRMTRNFTAGEFVCQHCGAEGIKPSFVEQLQRLRDYIGQPIRITSGYRCRQHPVEAAKAVPGRHTEGIAADITGPPLPEIWRALRHFPEFTGVGVSLTGNFIHLDTRALPAGVRRTRWAYDANGGQIAWSAEVDQRLGGHNV